MVTRVIFVAAFGFRSLSGQFFSMMNSGFLPFTRDLFPWRPVSILWTLRASVASQVSVFSMIDQWFSALYLLMVAMVTGVILWQLCDSIACNVSVFS